MISSPNWVGLDIIYSMTSACTDLEIKRSKVKVTR